MITLISILLTTMFNITLIVVLYIVNEARKEANRKVLESEKNINEITKLRTSILEKDIQIVTFKEQIFELSEEMKKMKSEKVSEDETKKKPRSQKKHKNKLPKLVDIIQQDNAKNNRL